MNVQAEELIIMLSFADYDSDSDFNPGAYVPESPAPKKRGKKPNLARITQRPKRRETLGHIKDGSSTAKSKQHGSSPLCLISFCVRQYFCFEFSSGEVAR